MELHGGAESPWVVKPGFSLGDRDLALHIRSRTQLLDQGLGLTSAHRCDWRDICAQLGLQHACLAHVRPTGADACVHTADGPLAFQHYFVRDRCEPTALGFEFAGAESATLNPAIPFEVLRTVVICPSNPYVSVDPILAVPGMRDALRGARCPVVAVSPIVGGAAIKGPTAKMMSELGVPVSTVEVARHYRGLATHFVIDQVDARSRDAVAALGLETAVAQTVMRTLDDRIALARAVLAFAP